MEATAAALDLPASADTEADTDRRPVPNGGAADELPTPAEPGDDTDSFAAAERLAQRSQRRAQRELLQQEAAEEVAAWSDDEQEDAQHSAEVIEGALKRLPSRLSSGASAAAAAIAAVAGGGGSPRLSPRGGGSHAGSFSAGRGGGGAGHGASNGAAGATAGAGAAAARAESVAVEVEAEAPTRSPLSGAPRRRLQMGGDSGGAPAASNGCGHGPSTDITRVPNGGSGAEGPSKDHAAPGADATAAAGPLQPVRGQAVAGAATSTEPQPKAALSPKEAAERATQAQKALVAALAAQRRVLDEAAAEPKWMPAPSSALSARSAALVSDAQAAQVQLLGLLRSAIATIADTGGDGGGGDTGGGAAGSRSEQEAGIRELLEPCSPAIVAVRDACAELFVSAAEVRRRSGYRDGHRLPLHL